MAIEIVDFPIKYGDFPQLCKRLPDGNIKIIAKKIHRYPQKLPIVNHPGEHPTGGST